MMWELIESNRRKSILLIFCLMILLFILGSVIGGLVSLAYQKDSLNDPAFSVFDSSLKPLMTQGAISGAAAGLAFASVLFLIAYFGGDGIFLDSVGARPITSSMHPTLFNVVDEMRIAANLKNLPKIYVMDEKAPNAFATGIHADRTAVTVTAGLLARLNRDELQGVVAHEMSHIMNRDVLFMTLSATMLGSIQMLSDGFMRSARYSDSSYVRNRSTRAGAPAGILIFIAALVIAALSVLLAKLFYFAISRRREYLADACAVRLTRYPEGLASALEKISSGDLTVANANQFTSASFIVNPLDAHEEGFLADLVSTHPPAQKRIAILRSMGHGASLRDYHQAFASVLKTNTELFPISELEESKAVEIRLASQESTKSDVVKSASQDVGDMIAAVNGFAFVGCLCGLRFKIPPHFEEKKIMCPRCGLVNEIPFSGPIGTTETAPQPPSENTENSSSSEGTQKYQRKNKGWESFFCSCGKLIQLSPDFVGSQTTCRFCQSKIQIELAN